MIETDIIAITLKKAREIYRNGDQHDAAKLVADMFLQLYDDPQIAADMASDITGLFSLVSHEINKAIKEN